MMKVLVGSLNPVKIAAAKEAFSLYFDDVEVTGINVESGVAVQPIGDDTYVGAENRADELIKAARKERIQADLFVGIEGGISEVHSRWFAFGVMCIKDKTGHVGFGVSPLLQMPKAIMDEIHKGKELGDVTDRLFKKKDSKHNIGAVGVLTNGRMDRKQFYVPGLIVALAPFVNRKLYEE